MPFKWGTLRCTKIMLDLRVKHRSEPCTDQGIQTRSVIKKSQRETLLQTSFQINCPISFWKSLWVPQHFAVVTWEDGPLSFQVGLICDVKCWSPQECRSPLKLVGLMSQSQRPSKMQFCGCVQTSRSALNLAHYVGHLAAVAAMWGHKSNIVKQETLKNCKKEVSW